MKRARDEPRKLMRIRKTKQVALAALVSGPAREAIYLARVERPMRVTYAP